MADLIKSWRDVARAVFAARCADSVRRRTPELTGEAEALAKASGVLAETHDATGIDGTVQVAGRMNGAGKVTCWVFPRLTEADGTETHAGSRLSRAGVYCTGAEAAALASVIRPGLKRLVRDRPITMFCYCPDAEPGDVAVATRVGVGPQAASYRFLLFPAAVIDRAAASSDAAGLARAGASAILPDALIDAGLDAASAACQADPEYAVAMAFAVRVAADLLVPDAGTTKAGKAAALAERQRARRADRLAGVVEAVRQAGVDAGVPADSAGCAVELAVVCRRLGAERRDFARAGRWNHCVHSRHDAAGRYWYEYAGVDTQTAPHGPTPNARNPDYVPPAGVVWAPADPASYLGWLRPEPGDGSRGAGQGGTFTGDTAARCWLRLAEYCDHFAARWLATGGRD